MKYIGGGCYMEKISNGLPPLKISKPSRKSQDKEDEIQKNVYMKPISVGMIGDSNYIGINLNGSIQKS